MLQCVVFVGFVIIVIVVFDKQIKEQMFIIFHLTFSTIRRLTISFNLKIFKLFYIVVTISNFNMLVFKGLISKQKIKC